MLVEARIVNAFTDSGAGGNPAGVVLGADSLDTSRKQEVARRIGVSETAFVSSSKTATRKLEFFTPTRQIAHCGHATIATFCLLRQLGAIGDGRMSKETIDGNRDVVVDGELSFMEQRAPRYRRVGTGSDLGKCVLVSLGLTKSQLRAGMDPFVVNTGNSFLLVPMPDERSVAELRPDLGRIDSLSDELDLIGYYVFSTATQVAGRHAGARMFAPRFGIPEESATGMAAGPLACFLHDRFGIAERELLIEQGRLMRPPSPSLIRVVLELTGDQIAGLMAGGTARAVSKVGVEV